MSGACNHEEAGTYVLERLPLAWFCSIWKVFFKGASVGLTKMSRLIIALMWLALPSPAMAEKLEYSPAPVGNPLKGLVPYAGDWGEDAFPHSMEFSYLPISAVMKGRDVFNWTALEKILEAAKKRGKQTVFRLYLEYPGKKSGVPEYLLKGEGVKLHRWENEGKEIFTPEYSDLGLQEAISQCIEEMGTEYDGDPRIGFITAGILGLWGEWHNYPRVDLAPKPELQMKVMKCYEKAFRKTPILLRYPAGKGNAHYADNSDRRFGYHDDSFAWATLDTGREEDDWFFVPSLMRAGVQEKWKKHPVGGEIRPEIWPTVFTEKNHPEEQEFSECVRQTHATWLLDTGMFSKKYPHDELRKKRALEEVRRMGYELHISEARMEGAILKVTIENRGVAPFYYDWPVLLTFSSEEGKPAKLKTEWKLSEILPGRPMEFEVKLGSEANLVEIQIPNPMKGGVPLRFANNDRKDGVLRLVGP